LWAAAFGLGLAWTSCSLTAATTDTDGDGLPDDWETSYGLNPNNPLDVCLDGDGDGALNSQEYRGGSNATNGSSVPVVLSINLAGFGDVVINFPQAPGEFHLVESTPSLAPPFFWTPLFIGGPPPIIEPVFGNSRYYRARRLDGVGLGLSANIVGYQNQTMAPGSNVVVNWLRSGDNAIAELIPVAPGGAYVVKGGMQVNSFDDLFFEWEDPAMPLPPGEPFVFFNSEPIPVTLTFIGEATLAPTVSSGPSDQTVQPGETVTWRVDAETFPEPTYQWRFNGTNLSGATCPVLTLSGVLPSQAGTYSVIVSNLAGAVTNSAMLIVEQSVALSAPSVTGGQIGFEVRGVAGARYAVEASADFVQWTSLFTNLAPFTFSNPVSPLPNRRFYRARLME
jgi:hypothetical protein